MVKKMQDTMLHDLPRRRFLRMAGLPLVGWPIYGLPALAQQKETLQPSSKRQVAITIDDGPASGSGDDLDAFERIAEGLRESFVREKVPAIMFVNERQLNVPGQRDRRAAVLDRWLDAGLELGNHTYSHLRLEEDGVNAFKDDIIKGEYITRPLLASRGQTLKWFRYPYLASGRGEAASEIEAFLAERDYLIAPVTVDYQDYSFTSAYTRYLRAGQTQAAAEHLAAVLRSLDVAFERAESRSQEILGVEIPQVLLIHCNELNALTLRQAIERIRARGYEFVSLETAFRHAAYHTPGLRAGGLGGGNLLGSIADALAS